MRKPCGSPGYYRCGHNHEGADPGIQGMAMERRGSHNTQHFIWVSESGHGTIVEAAKDPRASKVRGGKDPVHRSSSDARD